MTQTKQQFLSFEEYLSYDDGTENLYELLTLESDRYAEWRVFQNCDAFESPQLGQLNATANQIFAAAR